MNECSPLPPETSWLTPYLTVHKPDTIIDFYTKIFEFEVKSIVKDEDNKRVLFARFAYKDCHIAIGPDVAYGGRTGASSPKRALIKSPIVIYIYVDDLEARYQRCLQNNAKILEPLGDKPWGDRLFKVEDPEGYIWDFATPISSSHTESTPIA